MMRITTLLIAADLAIAFASWRGHVGGGAEPSAENRAVDILPRGEGCRWRIVRSSNYPLRPGR